MRSLIIFFILSVLWINSFGQSRTLISYDIETGEIEKIEDVLIPDLSSNKTNFYLGENNSIADLPTELDLDNLYEQSQFTNKKPANIDYSLSTFPIRTSIKLFSVEDDSLLTNCSGSLISSRHVLTAAHCISWGYQDFHLDSILACPVFNNGEFSPMYECSYVKKIYVFEDWSFWEEDFAILELAEPIGNKTGWISIAYDDNLAATNKLLHKFSYPALQDLYVSYNGDTLYHSYGYPDIFDEFNIGFTGADGVGGESGSSIIDIKNNESYSSYGVFTWVDDSKHSRMRKELFYPILEVISTDLMSATNSEFADTFITIYPNPASDKIYIKSDGHSGNKMHIRIYDLTGKLLLTSNQPVDESVDISFLKRGMYLIRLSNDKVDNVRSFLKID